MSEQTPPERRWALEPALPGRCYTSDGFFAQERAAIWGREWLCVGRAEEIPEPGDYLLADAAGERVLVTRTRQGELRGHYDVCRHRGCELALGQAPRPQPEAAPGPAGRFPGVIRCPYHSWTYELDGRLRSAPHLNEQIDRAQFGLHPVDVDTWGGFVFANLTGESARSTPLSEHLGAGVAYCGGYPLAELRAVRRITYAVAANWKVIVENYNECYHCAGVHPELCEIIPAFKQGGGMDLDWEAGVPYREGAYSFTRSGTTARGPFPGLREEERTLRKAWLFLPNLMLSLTADHGAAFTLWPRGPGLTTVVCDFLFHPAQIAEPGFDPSDAVEFWDLVNRQDWAVCAGVQRGMGSRAYTQGYFAPMEQESLDTRRYLRERMGDLVLTG